MFIVPDPRKVLLCDVSFWQDDNATVQMINFEKMKKEGVSGVIIRCGQNAIDPDFKLNWKNSRGVFPRGSYWFYSTYLKPSVQASKWIDALGDDLGEFYLWLDLEAGGHGGEYHGWQYWYDMLETLKQLNPKVKLGIYTGYYYWMENRPRNESQLNYFKQYPLWIATYGSKPMIPTPFEKEMLWQFTDNLNGLKYGAESKELDGNYFNGTIDEFYEITNWNNTNKPSSKIIMNYSEDKYVYKEDL